MFQERRSCPSDRWRIGWRTSKPFSPTAGGRSSTLELAKVIYSAKRRLRFGQWSGLWKLNLLPFSKRKGDMLVVIGKGLGSLDENNENNCSHLPTAWRTLYYLAQLDRSVLVNLITQETIHPALTIHEAKNLLASSKAKSNDSSRRPQIKRRLSNLQEFVWTTLQDWTPEERERARHVLLQLAQEIGSYGKTASAWPGCNADSQSTVAPIFNRQDQEISADENASARQLQSSAINGTPYLASPALEVLELRSQPSL